MEILLFLPVAFAAFCVWLTVRIVNRRERWAKWMLAVMFVTALFGYPLSLGPACWLTARPVAPPGRVVIAAGGAAGGGGGGGTLRPGDPPNRAMSVYYPLLDFLRRNSYTRMKPYSIEQAMHWWMRTWMRRGTEVKIPDPTGGYLGVRAKDRTPSTWQPSNFDPPIWILLVVCLIGIGFSIWYAPADAAICALLRRVPADPPPWWVWRVRVAGVVIFSFGLVWALYVYLLGW